MKKHKFDRLQEIRSGQKKLRYALPLLKEMEEDERDKKLRYNVQNRRYKTTHLLIRGVYKLFYDNVVVYVGQSRNNVFERISAHLSEQRIKFDSFTFKDCSNLKDSELNEVEIGMIKKWFPKYNTIHNKNA